MAAKIAGIGAKCTKEIAKKNKTNRW